MREVTIKLYKFDELSENAKIKVLSKFHDINTDHEWHDYILDDALSINLKITSFDIDKGIIEGDFTDYIDGVIPAILSQHSKECDTYKLALEYKEKLDVIEARHNVTDDDDTYTEERHALADDMLPELLELYLSMLKREYEYLSSEAAIIEAIRLNDYEFLSDGRLA